MNSISRRRALALTAAAIATPILLSRRGMAQSPNAQIGLGFIGCGKRTFELLDPFLGNSAFRVLAACDVDTKRRDHVKSRVDKKYGNNNCASVNDHHEVLSLADIDAVVIGTPDHWHAIQVIEACKAGKDIYCEKPLSLNIAEAKAMIDAVRKHNRVFQTGSQQRTEYEGKFRKACEYVRSGRIGRVLTVHVGVGESSVPCDLPEEPMEPGLDWDRWLGPAPKRPYNSVLSPRGIHDHYPQWRNYSEYSGGQMTDMGAHHFDIAQWGLGMDESGPVAVIPPSDPTAMHGAKLVYADGVEVIHGGPSGTTFIGTKGTIAVDRGRLDSTPDSILKEPLKDGDTHLPAAVDHIADWLDAIRTRRRPICDVEVGARSVTACHLLNLAYWHRRSLKWDAKAWRFPGDSIANGWRDYHRRDKFALPTI